jgi:hypothetical protein
MKNEIIEDREESLDELVVRARQDSELKRIIASGSAGNYRLKLEWERDFAEDIQDLSWTSDDQHIAVATTTHLRFRPVRDSTNHSSLSANVHAEKGICANAMAVCPYKKSMDHYLIYASGLECVYQIFSPQFKLIQSTTRESEKEIKAISFNSDGSKVLFSIDNGFEALSIEYNAGIWRFKKTDITVDGETTKACYFEDDKIICAYGNKIVCYDSELKRMEKEIDLDGKIVDFSVSDENLAIATTNPDMVRMVDDRLSGEWQQKTSKIAYSNKGDRIAIAEGPNVIVYRFEK